MRQMLVLICLQLASVPTTFAQAPDAAAEEPNSPANVESSANMGKPSTVFQAGEAGYKVFRIPAIVKASNGDFLAFCEARQGGDASEIDLVFRRSSDDGRTWGRIQVVGESSDYQDWYPSREITVGNPAPVVDLISREHPGRILLPFTVENDRVAVTFSDDHGKSWSPAREITSAVKLEQWGWYATGPVHSIQLTRGKHRGRIVVPCDHRLGDKGADRGPNGAHLIYSDDHGESWQLGAIDDSYDDPLNANETAVVELPSGELYLNTRDQHGAAPGTRGAARSLDGGASFVPTRATGYQAFRPCAAVLDPPVVQCSMLTIEASDAPEEADLVLFCGPDNDGPTGKGRSDLRLRISADGARSWRDGPLIHSGPAAYSDLVRLDSERIGILFEAGPIGGGPYQSIRFQVLGLSEL
ncbi:MAG TPA: alpha-sialidase [Planctomycetaceae bacterium]|nr:alpha-sialidase [Planctomycetaceae bacterium]